METRRINTKSSNERNREFDEYWNNKFGEPHDRIYEDGKELEQWLKEVIEDEIPCDILL